MPLTHLLLDLDGTLYPNAPRLWPAIQRRILRYMVERLGLTPETAQALRQRYVATYGPTLRGLQRHHGVDPHDFLHFVHDIPLTRYLQPDPRLRDTLQALPQTKWVFTNADAPHTQRVLRLLGVDDLFQGVIDLVAMDFYPKPHPHAFATALAHLGHPPPSQVAVVDDLPRNLRPARARGFFTVWVAAHPQEEDVAHRVIPHIYALPAALDGGNHAD